MNRPERAFVPATRTPARPTTFTAEQAIENSPSLGQLTDLIRESSARLKAIESLIPPALRASVKAGPIEADSWCLLVDGSAAAAKIRQLVPAIQQLLLGKGWKVNSIRLKILMAKRRSASSNPAVSRTRDS